MHNSPRNRYVLASNSILNPQNAKRSRYFSSFVRKPINQSISSFLAHSNSPSKFPTHTHLPSLTGESLANTLKAIKLQPKLNRSSLTARFSHQQFSQISPRYTNLTSRNSPYDLFNSMSLPILPQQVLNKFPSELTAFQQAEIFDYSQIYYFGLGAKKAQRVGGQNKHDNKKGDYTATVGDHIAYRYQIKKELGRGSFGQVHKCYDHKNKEEVAIKIIKNKRRFFKQGLVEVKILEHLKKRTNQQTVVVVKDSFEFRNHLCIVFELLNVSLYELLKSNHFRGFSLGLIRRLAIQILSTLSLSKQLRIIHCDLKPENILLKAPKKSGIKVIDFGSACFQHQKIYTYIQSRFYRAPQIILGMQYTQAIDMWSFGCVIAELFMGRPLLAGENEHQQLLSMMEVKGVPPNELLKRGSRVKKFFDTDWKPKLVPNSLGRIRMPAQRTVAEKMGCSDTLFVDLVSSKVYLECLEWVPEERMKPDQALGHPWILSGLE